MRLPYLNGFGLDALEDDEELQRIVRFAAKLCDAPTSTVSIVEEQRQWFLARDGIDVSETPRSTSFCGHAMLGSDLLIIPDATEDDRFDRNLLVTGEPFVRFYAGAPLITSEGVPVGALCVFDYTSRPGG